MNNIDVKILPSIPEKLSLSEIDITEIVTNSIIKLRPGLTDKLEIEIIFVDDDEIKKLNLEHRKIDAPTDVLSFPQEQVKESLVNILGSIVICLDKVYEKGEDPSDVIRHGLLHILGYDHEENENEWDIAAKKIDCKL